MESNEILTMRAMAWQRAKGELNAYLMTFWPSYSPSGVEMENGFNKADKKINDFIKDFEDNCR
jgi:hypothetical protein